MTTHRAARYKKSVSAALLFLMPFQVEAFDYLDRQANVVSTTHAIGFQISIDPSFDPLGELHHSQASRELMFHISVAAFARDGDIILVHAETLDDGSGVLDYRSLPRTTLSGIDFGFREQCIPSEAATELETNPEAQFVRENGFQLDLPFHLSQFLVASADGNAEVMISYGRKLRDCDDISDEFSAESRKRLAEAILIKRVR